MRNKVLVNSTGDSDTPFFSSYHSAGTMLAAGRAAATLMTCAATSSLALASAAVATPAAPRAGMAPTGAYLMDRAQEITLAKSAAPASVSNNATVWVFTRTGYETAVTGTNGFVCWVGRGFVGAFDAPERWNPKIRAADCENPQAARSVLPYGKLIAAMVLAGCTDAEIIGRIKTAVRSGEIPPLESGALSYMMSKSSYLTDQGGHDMPHLMFFVAVKHPADWGANAPDTPIIGGNYWFFTPGHEAEIAALPKLSVFLTGVANWSDGTPAAHRM
jgi:hypothetical protein